MPDPVALLMLPRTLETFLHRDQAEDLLRAPGVYAVDAPRLPYGALARLPTSLGDGLGFRAGRRMKLPGDPRAIVIFHPVQYPLVRGLLSRHPDCELWYGLGDRYEVAYDASERLRGRLRELHAQAAERAALVFTVSDELTALERAEGREAVTVGLTADSFPDPDPGAAVIAVCLGHLGWRNDWALLRAVAEGMPELTVLLVGAWHEDECRDDDDFAACRSLPNLVWLGRRSDEEAARLILCADVGILPFRVEPFNDAALPYRILKYARLGRRTVTPELRGVLTWEHAVLRGPDAAGWIAALRSQAGVRTRPDLGLREWALAQTARRVNAPLWDRLEALGVPTGRLGSERAGAPAGSARTP